MAQIVIDGKTVEVSNEKVAEVQKLLGTNNLIDGPLKAVKHIKKQSSKQTCNLQYYRTARKIDMKARELGLVKVSLGGMVMRLMNRQDTKNARVSAGQHATTLIKQGKWFRIERGLFGIIYPEIKPASEKPEFNLENFRLLPVKTLRVAIAATAYLNTKAKKWNVIKVLETLPKGSTVDLMTYEGYGDRSSTAFIIEECRILGLNIQTHSKDISNFNNSTFETSKAIAKEMLELNPDKVFLFSNSPTKPYWVIELRNAAMQRNIVPEFMLI